MAPVFLVARPEVDGPVETVDACLSEREGKGQNGGLSGEKVSERRGEDER